MSAVRIPALAEHTASVIFLHGLGDSGNGWRFLADEFRRLQKLNHVAFVFPNAPIQKVTLNFGMEMPSWYDIQQLNKIEQSEDEAGMLESAGRLRAYVDAEIAAGIPAERIVIGGFSQGCTISVLTGLTTDRTFAGVVGLSGYLPLRDKIAGMHTAAGKATPFFWGHGTDDQVVKYEYGTASKAILEALGQPLEFHTYPGMTHSTCPRELGHVLDFLERRLPPQ
ncbi:Phospholipase/carboxylesterase/thioesterase [Dipodascopsis tothii]|uniref:Phospholipase/carboxylesterase/thioesterase n=1 Tax=Dipodascopsis tothii TaxID=44089 RepID=UPI0034CE8E14